MNDGEVGRLQRKKSQRALGEHRSVRIVHKDGGRNSYRACNISGSKPWFNVLWQIIERERR